MNRNPRNSTLCEQQAEAATCLRQPERGRQVAANLKALGFGEIQP